MHRTKSSRRTNLVRAQRLRTAVESLEGRLFLAAHVVGDPTVYATVQDAVNAAAPGGIVNVDAGTYPELVRINKSLIIRGAQAGNDARSNVRSSAAGSVMTGYDLGGVISSSFYINADNVTIDGFTVQGNTSQGTYGAGIVIAPGRSGTHILNNIVQNNIAGLYLSNASDSLATVIRHNVFRENNNAGGNGGRAIYTNGEVAGAVLTNVLIDGNYFYHNTGSTGTTTYEAAIAFEGRSNIQKNITISNNVMDYNGKAVLMWNMSNVTIRNNSISNSRDQWSGSLRFEGGVNGATITGNTVYENYAPALRIDSKGFTASSSGFVITGNNFFRNSLAYTNKQSLIVGSGTYVGSLNATGNWWGAANGPSGDGTGSGDAISGAGKVTFSPWSTVPLTVATPSYLGAPSTVGAPIQIENFNHGGEGIGYHEPDTANSGGKYRPNAAVDIESTTDVGGGYDIGWTRPGEWMEYALDVPASGPHRLDIRVANNQTGGKFHVEIDGQNVTGAIAPPNTGGWQKWIALSVNNINLTAGSHRMRVVFDTAGTSGNVANINWVQWTATTPVPAAPSNLTAAASGFTRADLAWTDNATDELGFAIERRTNWDGDWQPLTTVAAGQTSYTDTSAVSGTLYAYRIRAIGAQGNSAWANEAMARTPVLLPVAYISDLPFAGAATNGWGPVERDMSNAGQNAGDGNPITINGVVYPKGLGVHAPSSVSIDLGGQYNRFVSDIGVDDEVLYGSVTFQVWADGTMLYESPVMDGSMPAQSIDLDVTGKQTLTLIVTNGGDDNDYDHADWANARLLMAPDGKPAAASGVTAKVVSPTQVDLTWLDNANNEDGYTVERSTDGVNFTPVATLAANSNSYSDATAAQNTTYTYRIRAFNANGNSIDALSPTVTTPVAPPAAPTSLVATPATTQINLTWTDAATTETGFFIERSSDGINFTQIATVGANVTSYSDTAAVSGIAWTYRVRAVNGTVTSDYSNTSIATLPVSVPAGWTRSDIGTVGIAGDSVYSAGTWTVKGSGADIWNAADSFHFAYRAVTGNFTITARVTSVQGTDPWAKAGVMLRDTLAANARNVTALVTPGNGVTAQQRTSTGRSTTSTYTTGLKAPYWVRVVRSGSFIYTYRSANGTTWTLMKSVSISLPTTLYVGLAVTAHNNAALCTATFDNVNIA